MHLFRSNSGRLADLEEPSKHLQYHLILLEDETQLNATRTLVNRKVLAAAEQAT